MQFVILLASGTCSALASVLLRLAGRGAAYHGAALPWLATPLGPLLYRLAAIGAYGAGFVLYALALKRVELSIAYPLMVTVTILEILLFSAVLGETMSLRTLAGAAFLIVGIALLYVPAASAS
jgi:small multidrug resistance pump